MPQRRYEVLGTIGIGATCRVDQAHDTLIDRTVALKTFGHGFGSEELQKQFLREAQILGRLSHPNVVSIYDLGTNDDGSVYLVMEYVPGKTLESVMAAKGPSTLERTAVWAADLASALHRAHRAGIIHGDVKPANIFVTDDGQLKLGDFGIAKFATQVSGTGRLVGTPAYLSPEQIKGETQDHRSDIFSLGIILYQLATGVRPFDGTSVAAVCAQIVATEPPPPSQHNPALPKEFDRIVMRCLKKDPAARYASGESLAASLYPFARSRPESPNFLTSSWWRRPLRPRDAWTGAGVFAAVLLAIPLTHFWNRSDSASPPVVHIPLLPAARTTVSPFKNPAPANPRAVSSGSTSRPPRQAAPAAAPLQAGGKTSGSTAAGSRAGTPQASLGIEITSALGGETLAIFADQQLVATSPLSITRSGESLHLDRLLATGAHEFRIALYRADKSLHLERQGLAELQPGDHNLLAIRVVKRSKMLVKRDAELEIRWPGLSAPNDTKQPGSIEAASAAPVSAR